MARPATRPINLKEGYYIEVNRMGENKGIKIRRNSYKEIQAVKDMYEPHYEVTYLGKCVDGDFKKVYK